MKALEYLAEHLKGLGSMANLYLEEAKRQLKQAKFKLRSTLFCTMDFKEFLNHVSVTYDEHLAGFPVLLILVRVTLLIVCDSSCCEVGYSALIRTLTAARSRLKVSTVRDVLTTHFLGDEIKIFKARPAFDMWTELPFTKTSNNAWGRQLKK